ncbi:5'-3' exonuclease H3TH domain-containing protein [Deinococcus deserti]|uniref:Putative 5-3 exonuclease n=1 Tax=Deinococcus deserti (strain DSM 17065 / CIP 109153 / LMG 22923 / VCD115) TaxID=546414 RepID=C1D1X0_DEIDV|nr:5'-3' exonuclease H3TH domain-containing protein [Deinococcus deserti]ACO47409.1 putative 5-3 exonuclease [Deinococcus deserti VCD115]
MTALLIDSSNAICRAYYGRAGGQAHAVPQVLCEVVWSLQHRFQAEHVIAALDDTRNFRQSLYESYKGHRTPKPADLTHLLTQAAELMGAAGAIPALAPNHEADDVMGTLARRAPGRAVIVTSDRDLFSAVTETVQVYEPRSRTVITVADVQARFGVSPERIPLFKSLCGDSSDNIPGVRGLGEKAASVLAAQCGTVDEIFERVSTFDRRYQKALLAADPMEIRLFHQLATVRTDAPVARVPLRR